MMDKKNNSPRSGRPTKRSPKRPTIDELMEGDKVEKDVGVIDSVEDEPVLSIPPLDSLIPTMVVPEIVTPIEESRQEVPVLNIPQPIPVQEIKQPITMDTERYDAIIRQQNEMIVAIQQDMSQVVEQQKGLAKMVTEFIVTSAQQNLDRSMAIATQPPMPIQNTDGTAGDQVLGSPNGITMAIAQIASRAPEILTSLSQFIGVLKMGREPSAPAVVDPVAAIAPAIQNFKALAGAASEIQKVFNDTQVNLFKQNMAKTGGGVDEEALADSVARRLVTMLSKEG